MTQTKTQNQNKNKQKDMSPIETSRKDYEAEIAKSKRRVGEIKYTEVSDDFAQEVKESELEEGQDLTESFKQSIDPERPDTPEDIEAREKTDINQQVENNDQNSELIKLQKEYNDTLALIDWSNKLIEKTNADRAKLIEYHMKKQELEEKIKSL